MANGPASLGFQKVPEDLSQKSTHFLCYDQKPSSALDSFLLLATDFARVRKLRSQELVDVQGPRLVTRQG